MDAKQARKRTKEGIESAKRRTVEREKNKREQYKKAYNTGAKEGFEKAYRSCQQKIIDAADQGRTKTTFSVSQWKEENEQYYRAWVAGATEAVAKKLREEGFRVIHFGTEYRRIDYNGPPCISATIEISWKE